MQRMIPPIGTRGLYSLKAPWATTPNVLYSCAAIREFIDLENLGTKVFETYYLPVGLTRADYEEDQRNNELIITLTSDTTAPLYVPSSYIASMPDLSHRNYQHVVLSASLGPLPDYIDLTFAKSQVASVLSDTLGMEPEVHLSVAPISGVITPTEHDALEAARQAAIGLRTTPHAKVLELQQQNTALMQRLAVMEQILRDRDLLPS